MSTKAGRLGSSIARALKSTVGVEEDQLGRAGRLVALVFVVSAALVVAKAAQSGVFLSAYGRDRIPWAFAASAAVLATLSAGTVAGQARLGPARMAQVTLACSALALAALSACLGLHARALAFVAYVVVEAIAGLLLIQMWSVVSAAVDPRSAKRVLPIAGVGAGVAWTIGGLVTPALVRALSARGLLVIAAALVASGFGLATAVGRHDVLERRPSRGPTLLEGWKRGLRVVADVPLVRLTMLLGVLALLTEQIMDLQLMAVARERCTDATSITAFFGRYYGVTSALGVVLLLAVSGRALSRWGAPQLLVLTPLVTLAIALVATAFPAVATFVALRSTDRVLKQALWSAAQEQVQTPLGATPRAQARALGRGVVSPITYGLLALGLTTLPAHLDMRWLTGATAIGTLLMTLTIMLWVRKAYVRALRRAIDGRTLVLDAHERVRLDPAACTALEAELRSSDEDRAMLAAELLADAEGPGVERLLTRVGLVHEFAEVRRLAVEGLARARSLGAADAIAARIGNEPNASVRVEAVRALRVLGRGRSEARVALETALGDADARVRALAEVVRAEHDDPRGIVSASLIAEMLRAGGARRTAALGAVRRAVVSDPAVLDALRDVLADPDLYARIGALRVVTRLRIRVLLSRVAPMFDDPRTAPLVLDQLSNWDEDMLEQAWASHASDDEPPSTLASPASIALAPLGGGPLAHLLTHPNAAVRAGTFTALGRLVDTGKRRPVPRALVEPLLLRDVAYGHGLSVISTALDADDRVGPDARAELARELELEARELRDRILLLLALAGQKALSRSVEAGLRKGEREAHTAELLEMTLPSELARSLVPLFEAGGPRARAQKAVGLGLATMDNLGDLVGAVLAHADEHILGCAMMAFGPRLRERAPDVYEAEAKLLPLYERMRFLRRVPLFEELGGDDLRQVAQILLPISLPAGHVIFRKGEQGDELFVIVRGLVLIRDGDTTLAKLGERNFFGELAVLDREARSADAVCDVESDLFRLQAADFEELMARRPPIRQHVLLTLVRRLRSLVAL